MLAVVGMVLDRIIPARAGNTPYDRTIDQSHADHPRSRGEHPRKLVWLHCASGSSPLARGTLVEVAQHLCVRRIIPARAGNTGPSTIRSGHCADHPRSRGEHIMRPAPRRCAGGSSPLARGTRAGDDALAPGRRIIPARAGNTRRPHAAPAAAADHPRSRGEHLSTRWMASAVAGSSPLARGTRPREAAAAGGERIIPARAGNTLPRSARPSYFADHPRSRGEHVALLVPAPNSVGSSPLARGTLRIGEAPVVDRRIIPARAGNTPSCRGPSPKSTDHPRSRGEHGTAQDGTAVNCGSSPLARGTLNLGRWVDGS